MAVADIWEDDDPQLQHDALRLVQEPATGRIIAMIRQRIHQEWEGCPDIKQREYLHRMIQITNEFEGNLYRLAGVDYGH